MRASSIVLQLQQFSGAGSAAGGVVVVAFVATVNASGCIEVPSVPNGTITATVDANGCIAVGAIT